MSELNRIAEIFARLGEPVFLVRQLEGRGTEGLILHTMERRGAGRLAGRAREALRREGAALDCRVVAHNPRALRRMRSLEALSRRFAGGAVVYDPTGFVGRSEAVTACARRLRANLGEAVQNIYLDTSRRTLYVIVRELTATSDTSEVTKARIDLVRRAGAIMREWQQSVGQDFALAVRIGTEPPRGVRLVSVDHRSVTQTIYSQVFARKGLVRGALAVGAAALFGAAVTVPAAADPAVAKTNGSIIVQGGSYDLNNVSDDNGEGELLGKVTFPLGTQFGGQVEGGFGTNEWYGAGGHLFWRDPSWAMLGAYVSYDNNNSFDFTRYAVEGELYLDRVTAHARAGGQSGDFGDGFFGSVDVSFYAMPDLAVRGGVEFEPDDGRDTVGRLGFEWQPALDSSPGLSIFADGEWGDDYEHVRAGLKIHFGSEGVSLIDRERKFDPGTAVPNRRDYGEVEAVVVPLPD
jgi:hypothetical protein